MSGNFSYYIMIYIYIYIYIYIMIYINLILKIIINKYIRYINLILKIVHVVVVKFLYVYINFIFKLRFPPGVSIATCLYVIQLSRHRQNQREKNS